MKSIKANIVDLFNRRVYPGEVHIKSGVIEAIMELQSGEMYDQYILPGFVDAHIHIESSMMTPSFFAHEAVRHGTVATVSDPHEIANVCGVEGIEFMINNARESPLKVAFGAPSCVPATNFETAGARLSAEDVNVLLQDENIYYLAEVMNFPGVINNDESILQMIRYAQDARKPVDGHAPQLRFPDINAYFSKGISTDHECLTIEEALEKLSIGCKILIREGSAAKNYKSLAPLISEHFDKLMFCSDDKHPDELVIGHINSLVVRAIEEGYDMFNVLRMACVNPVNHYGLHVGLLREGEAADFIIVKDLKQFDILETWIDGEKVFSDNTVHFMPEVSEPVNHFNLTRHYSAEDFMLKADHEEATECLVIGAIDGQLITERIHHKLSVIDGVVQNDVDNDILKCVVVNRYHEAPPSVTFIKNFGLKNGAIVSSVAHDSHNIIVVGADDDSIAKAVNTIIDSRGGIAYVNAEVLKCISLEIAGLMTQKDARILAKDYIGLNKIVRENGCTLSAPFMTLSFMALPVIPHLKITDLGLFDVDRFSFV